MIFISICINYNADLPTSSCNQRNTRSCEEVLVSAACRNLAASGREVPLHCTAISAVSYIDSYMMHIV